MFWASEEDEQNGSPLRDRCGRRVDVRRTGDRGGTLELPGSAAWASVLGHDRVEPVLANGTPDTGGGASGDLERCASADVGADNLATPLGIGPDVLSARTASAQTSITPANGRPIEGKVETSARIEDLALPLGSGAVVIGARAVYSRTAASCVGGKPVLEGASEVVGLTLGGQAITIDDLLAQIQDLLAPLGPIIDLRINEQVREGNALTVRPVHLKVLSAAGASPLLEVVVGESRVLAGADTCDPSAPGNLPPGTGTPGPGAPGAGTPATGNPGGVAGSGGSSTDVRPCPQGSQLDADSGNCIIPATATESVIVVGRPFEGPSGGRVVRLSEARKVAKSPCLSGPGPRYAILGTAGNDRITGTNNTDRMLGLGGNDQISGGRGNDCLDGMAGRDVLSGSIGDDRLYA